MADEKQTQEVTASAAQDAANSTPQAGEETFDLEYVKRLRAEAAQYRTKLRDLEQQIRARDEEKMTESERLQAKLAEVERIATEREQLLKQRTTEYEVKLKASELGIVDPEAAWRLLDSASIEFDDSGHPTNIEQLLKELTKTKPYLVKSLQQQYAATNPSRSNLPPTTFTRAQLRDPKFFVEHRDEILRAIREGRIIEE